MSKLIYKMGGVSADSYIAGPDGRFDWTVPDQELQRFHIEQVGGLGGYLLGRRLYEMMLYWETADQDSAASDYVREFAPIWRALPKVVFSRTLESVEGKNTTLALRDLPSELASLQQAGRGDVEIGGAGLAAEAVRLDLIDEYRLLIHPVAVGGGIPFFPRDSHVEMELLETRTLMSRVVYLRYRAAGH